LKDVRIVPEPTVLAVTRLTERHQTTVPVRVMDKLGLRKDGAIMWVLYPDGTIVVDKASLRR